jgi:hypothetical protein
MIFSFSSFDTLAVVLLQKNDEGFEQPISFFSRALRDAELKYDIMEKQAYALVKALKRFQGPCFSFKDHCLCPFSFYEGDSHST